MSESLCSFTEALECVRVLKKKHIVSVVDRYEYSGDLVLPFASSLHFFFFILHQTHSVCVVLIIFWCCSQYCILLILSEGWFRNTLYFEIGRAAIWKVISNACYYMFNYWTMTSTFNIHTIFHLKKQFYRFYSGFYRSHTLSSPYSVLHLICAFDYFFNHSLLPAVISIPLLYVILHLTI